MIGYYHEPDVDDLTACLHTALFSTLIALVWVFLVALPVRYIMQWWDSWLYGVADPDNIDETLCELSAAASGLGKGLKEAGANVKSFNENMAGIQKKMTGSAESFSRIAADSQTVLARMENSLNAQAKTLEKQGEMMEKLQDVLGTFTQVFEDMQGRNSELAEELAEQRKAREYAEIRLMRVINALGPGREVQS